MISRRRFISILAGATALPLMGSSAFASTQSWKGVALGANAQIILDHPDAASLIELSLAEIARLEAIFSLYDQNSQLSQLNANGVLHAPAFELLDLAAQVTRAYRETDGAFDPTIQPLWALYAKSLSQGVLPSETGVKAQLPLVGWDKVSVEPHQIAFAQKGMALTFNGIAQGYIADRVAALLKAKGVRNVMVNAGEINALGQAPNGEPWQVNLAELGSQIPLSNQAIATSSPFGTLLSEERKVGHMIDPRTGKPAGRWSSISVIDKSAARADALSTAFAMMTKPQIEKVTGSHQIVFGTAI